MQNLMDLGAQWISLSPAPEHALFHSSYHRCRTEPDQEKLAGKEKLVYSWTQWWRGAAWKHLLRTPKWEVDTWEGRANLQEDLDRLEERANNFLFFLHRQKHESAAATCAGETAEACSPLSRRWRALRAARSEMCHMLMEFESPSGGAAQVAEGHSSKLLCAQTPALPSIFQCSPSWHRQG